MDEITFPVTVTMEQMLRHNAAMDELARLRSQVEALTADAVIRANRQAILIDALRRIERTSADYSARQLAWQALNVIKIQEQEQLAAVPVDAPRSQSIWAEDQVATLSWLRSLEAKP